jgi:hypothetical protein
VVSLAVFRRGFDQQHYKPPALLRAIGKVHVVGKEDVAQRRDTLPGPSLREGGLLPMRRVLMRPGLCLEGKG